MKEEEPGKSNKERRLTSFLESLRIYYQCLSVFICGCVFRCRRKSTRSGRMRARTKTYQWSRCRKNNFAPNAAVPPVQPQHLVMVGGKRWLRHHFSDQVVDAILKFEVLRTEAVGWNPVRHRRNRNQQGITVEPPREPLFELRLPSKFVHQIAVNIQDRAVADQMPRSRGGVEFLCNLCVQNPKLPVKSRCFVYREGRTPRHFRHQIDVVVGLFQQRANFVCERGFTHAVRANQGKFQGLG